MSVRIIGTGTGLPATAVSNEDLTAFLDTSDDWITSRTGIRNRFICTAESLTDLAVHAASEALSAADLPASAVDVILCTTIGGDYRTPSLACCVAERLGISCPAFDINAACAGFLYALDLAALYTIRDPNIKVLIICADRLSAHVDWQDRSTCVLFGDGAGAALVTHGNTLRHMHLTTQPQAEVLYAKNDIGNSPFATPTTSSNFLHMNGQEVFRFAVNAVEQELSAALTATQMTIDDINWFLLHQANHRILESARTRLKLPAERFPTNIEHTGNISSASLPVLLDDLLRAGRVKQGDALFLTAFGAGLTCGGAMFVWE